MDTKEYITEALRTESKIDAVVVNPTLLGSVFTVLIAAGNILDQIKKHTYYDRDYDTDKLVAEFTNIVGSLDYLKQSIVEIQQAETKMMPYSGEGETTYDPRIFHSIVGITTEAVELIEALSSPEFDKVNFIEELGDLNWYQAIGIDAVGSSFDDVMETNINKLSKSDKARYKDGFTADEANNRDLDAEREILEDGNS
jgi:NTP pyrophosphatase (non-canonical NTP hydrolase)